MKPNFAIINWVAIVLTLSSLNPTVASNQDAKESAELATSSDISSAIESDDASFEDPRVSSVGYPKLIFQHVIPGAKVVAKPIANKAQPMIVRIVDTYSHGSDFRYDIEYKGLEQGSYNLADFLEREDGSQSPIPAITVEVKTLLGPGQVLPYELPPVRSGYQSFYLPAILIGGAAWLGGLLLILFYGRGKNKRPSQDKQQLTVADRLRPLIDAAIAGDLDAQEQAELERVLSAFWSKKLRLSHLPATDLREKLRSHPEASLMLTQIDAWLHRPATDPQNQVDVNEILKPYQSMNYEEV